MVRERTLVSGRRASATLPSDDSPSVAMITAAFCPLARSSSATDVTAATTLFICAQRGVGPAGLSASASFRKFRHSLSESSPRPTMTGSAPFRRRNSLGTFRDSDSSARKSRDSESSDHRVHFTILRRKIDSKVRMCSTNVHKKHSLCDVSMFDHPLSIVKNHGA